MPPATTQANHRQRGDGRWPSGNNRSTKEPASPIVPTHVQESTAIAHSAPGSPAARACLPYAPAGSTRKNPIPSITHPSAFLGCRSARTNPMIGNSTKARR